MRDKSVPTHLKDILLVDELETTESGLQIVESLAHVTVSCEGHRFKTIRYIRHLKDKPTKVNFLRTTELLDGCNSSLSGQRKITFSASTTSRSLFKISWSVSREKRTIAQRLWIGSMILDDILQANAKRVVLEYISIVLRNACCAPEVMLCTETQQHCQTSQ